MATQKPDITQETYWQSIFRRSKVNGADYNDSVQYPTEWAWPRDTWLNRRRQFVNGGGVRKNLTVVQRRKREGKP